MRYRWIPGFIIGIVVLGSCRGLEPEPVRHRSALSTGRDVGAHTSFNISSSTDCIEPGQPLVLTLTLYSFGSQPITLLDTPPVDIILLRDAGPAASTRVIAWSETSDYPPTIPPLQPPEIRPYTWTWTPTEAVGPLWVDVQLHIQTPDGMRREFSGHTLKVGVGTGYGELGAEYVLVPCTTMAPAR
jgi:hypothetical protein